MSGKYFVFFLIMFKLRYTKSCWKTNLIIEELKMHKKNNLQSIHLFLLAFWEVTEFEIVPVPVASLETF